MVTYIIVIIFIVLILALWIWWGTKQWAKEDDRINKEMEKNSIENNSIEVGSIEKEGFLDNLHDSINIVSDYGAILQTRDEGKCLYLSESRLPHSRKEIVDAILSVESFIEIALNDDSFRKLFIENHDYFRFDKTQAEYLLSEKYRELLKTSLAYLDGLVSDEKAEEGKTFKKVLDHIKEEEITADNLTALESEDFKKILEGFLKELKKSKK